MNVRRALLSVSDKTGIEEFSRALHGLGVEILSTGGTAKLLADADIPVVEVSEYTGFPEMMDGRVKTLHPMVHGGLLALRDDQSHVAAMEQHLINPIDLLVVNRDAGIQLFSNQRQGIFKDLAVEAARQFAEMKASMPLETDRAKIDYIHCVAEAVVLQLPPEYRDLDWEMAIFQADSVNAFAMPGGKIGVMTGILKAAQNQHQLAAVLGHEVAHVTARHANERASRGSFSNVGVQVAAVLLGGGHSGATYTAYEALNAGAALGILSGGLTLIGGALGVAPGADIYAVKVCSSVSTSCSGIALIQGMDFAVDPNGDGDTSDFGETEGVYLFMGERRGGSKILAMDVKRADAYMSRGIIRQSRGDWDRSRSDFEHYLKTTEDYFERVVATMWQPECQIHPPNHTNPPKRANAT